MSWFIRILFVFFVFPFTVYSQNFDADIGVSFLAAMHEDFPCKRIRRMVDSSPRPYLGVLYGSFGDSTKCLERFISASGKKHHTLQFYLSNEVCRRKGNCYSQELEHDLTVSAYNKLVCKGRRGTISRIKKRMLDIRRFCDEKGSEKTRCLLAIGLESQFSRCAAQKLVVLAKESGWHKKEIVHNPVPGTNYQGDAGAYYVEYHGRSLRSAYPPERTIATLDGIDPDFCRDKNGRQGISNRITAQDMQRWTDSYKDRASYLGYWCSVHQGITGDSGTSPNPKERTPHVAPGDVSEFIRIADQKRQKDKPVLGDYNTKRCTEVYSAQDGNGGFLWKESEHRGLVVLLPGKYDIQFNKVQVIKPYGGKEPLHPTGWANSDADGPRQHWRLNKAISDFPNKIVVRATMRESVFSEKQVLCWKVFRAGKRND